MNILIHILTVSAIITNAVNTLFIKHKLTQYLARPVNPLHKKSPQTSDRCVSVSLLP